MMIDWIIGHKLVSVFNHRVEMNGIFIFFLILIFQHINGYFPVVESACASRQRRVSAPNSNAVRTPRRGNKTHTILESVALPLVPGKFLVRSEANCADKP